MAPPKSYEVVITRTVVIVGAVSSFDAIEQAFTVPDPEQIAEMRVNVRPLADPEYDDDES